MSNRRYFFTRLASLGAGWWAGGKALAQQEHSQHQHAAPPSPPPRDRTAFETPDLAKLPYRLVDGVKEFRLIAEVVRTEFVPGRVVDAWGFNGSVPGPTMEVEQGDKVRVIFENRLPEMTAIHWHGFEVPMQMDGSVGLGQDPVPPGGRFTYEFTLDQHGTFFYHSHFAMQEMMGMIGLFIMHPKEPQQPRVDRDFGLVLQEWALLANNTVPNTLAMEFNWLTFNGKSGPAATPMLVKLGERVRIRLVNLGMDHHPIHLHGNQFVVTGTEAGRTPQPLWYPQNTVLVGVAQARDIEFEAKYAGDWMLHCHMPHHMMNQMASMAGPVTHLGHGLQTGAGMQEGMGMLRRGGALAEESGPALGRGLGLAADRERATTHLAAAQQSQHAGHQMEGIPMAGMAGDFYPKDDPEKKKIPGYPQDMWMPLDEWAGDKPEHFGLRKGWSSAMMGMMTLVRVLPEETYDKIMALRQQQPKERIQNEHKHPA